MKIIITSKGENLKSKVDPRFGRAKMFILYDTENGNYELIDNKQNLNAVQGAGIQAGQTVADTEAEALITGNCGPKAFSVLSAGSVKVYIGASGTIEEAIEDFKNDKLKCSDQANVDGHWN